ncbi:MAG: DNA integrity scanning protein DisA nucleotide-binding domain protein, partial [Gemmatimonadetes bacterium]|nr:DNA integrity scanning protein DisA nucleotide-binding domain protein [Gemmatimonadota bacterium]
MAEETMQAKNRAVLEGAVLVARETEAAAVLLAAAVPEAADFLRRELGRGHRVLAARTDAGRAPGDGEIVVLPQVRLRRRGRAKIALLEALAAGQLRPGERVVIISGNGGNGDGELDTVAVVDLVHEEELLDGEADAPLTTLAHATDPAAFDALLNLCVELGHEGREGKRVGLLATLGDHEAVLAHSHPIVLNPFEGHPEDERCILNAPARRALREFSGMDGAFVVREDGVVLAGGRYLEDVSPDAEVPSGLGARHRAAAGVTAATHCIA